MRRGVIFIALFAVLLLETGCRGSRGTGGGGSGGGNPAPPMLFNPPVVFVVTATPAGGEAGGEGDEPAGHHHHDPDHGKAAEEPTPVAIAPLPAQPLPQGHDSASGVDVTVFGLGPATDHLRTRNLGIDGSDERLIDVAQRFANLMRAGGSAPFNALLGLDGEEERRKMREAVVRYPWLLDALKYRQTRFPAPFGDELVTALENEARARFPERPAIVPMDAPTAPEVAANEAAPQPAGHRVPGIPPAAP